MGSFLSSYEPEQSYKGTVVISVKRAREIHTIIKYGSITFGLIPFRSNHIWLNATFGRYDLLLTLAFGQQ